jgi:hypothetical protein
VVEVDIRPTQTTQLASAHPRERTEE